MPNPGKTEDEETFIKRCMEKMVGEEGYDQSQAYAVCKSKWVNQSATIPVKQLILNAEGGVNAISLVDEPAIEMDFIFFGKEDQEEYKFKATDTEKRILSGPVLIPDIEILRKKDNEYYKVFMTKETIEKVSEKYLYSNNQHNVTLDHDEKVQDICLVESWIVNDSECDKSKTLGYSVPKGTWFASFKVNNDDIWENFVKTGKVKGFSIEGAFTQFEKINEDDILMEKIKELLNNIE